MSNTKYSAAQVAHMVGCVLKGDELFIFEGRLLHKLPFTLMAKELGISPQAVKSKLLTAVSKVERNIYLEYDMDFSFPDIPRRGSTDIYEALARIIRDNPPNLTLKTKDELLQMHLKYFNLKPAVYQALVKDGLSIMQQIVSLTERGIRYIPGIGPSGARDIAKVLLSFGLEVEGGFSDNFVMYESITIFPSIYCDVVKCMGHTLENVAEVSYMRNSSTVTISPKEGKYKEFVKFWESLQLMAEALGDEEMLKFSAEIEYKFS